MSTFAWIVGTNLVTFFITWRLCMFYAHRLPAVLDRTNGSKMHEYLDDSDVEWIKNQLKQEDTSWLRKK